MSESLRASVELRDDIILNPIATALKVSGPLSGSNTNNYHALYAALPEIVAALWHQAPLKPLHRSYLTWETCGDFLPDLLAFFLTRAYYPEDAKTAVRTLLKTWLSLEAELSGACLEMANLALPITHPLWTTPERFMDVYGDKAWEYIVTQANGKRAFVRLSHLEKDTVFLRLTARQGELVLPEGFEAPIQRRRLFARFDFLAQVLAEEATRGPVAYHPKTDEAKLKALVEATSLSFEEILLLWVGLPNFNEYVVDFLKKPLREALRLKQKEAKEARASLQDGFLRGPEALLRVAAMAQVPQGSDLWGDAGLEAFGRALAQYTAPPY